MPVRHHLTFNDLRMQRRAAAYLSSAKGLGRDEAALYEALRYVGQHKQQAPFDEAVHQLNPKYHGALDVIQTEFASNPLEAWVNRSRFQRAVSLYQTGQDQNLSSDGAYRLEGVSRIFYELFHAFKQHFVLCSGLFAALAITASFIPYFAALLSAGITAKALHGWVQSERQASKEQKYSPERAEALIRSGENSVGVAINFLPLAEVAKHLDEGTTAIMKAYAGQHAIHHELSSLNELPSGLALLKSIPDYGNAMVKLAAALSHYKLSLPEKLLVDAGKELQQTQRAIKMAFSYESNFTEVADAIKLAIQSGKPLNVVKAVQTALLAQIKLAVILIDEIMFPFVNVLQSLKARQQSARS